MNPEQHGRPAGAAGPDAPPKPRGREATARNSVTVVAWTLVSRVAGLVRVLVIGALMGPTYFANIFQAGYVLPNTIHTMIAGQLLAAVLIPTIVRMLDAHGRDRAAEVLGRVSGRILGIAVAGAALLCLASPGIAWAFTAGIPDAQRHRAWLLTIILILFVAPQIVGYAVAALGVAAQQAQGRFALAAAAPAIENIGTIVTVLLAAWIYGIGLEVDAAPTAMMVFLGVGTTASVVLHCGLQMYGAHQVGLLVRPSRGWRDDEVARDALRRVVRSVPVAACPSATNFVLTVVSSTVPGGVLVVQLAYQVFYALSFLGARAVAMAALPRLAQAAAGSDPHAFGVAWRQGLYLAVAASLPSLCLLAAFAHPTADLLANGELRQGGLIGMLAGCLAVAAVAQAAGGLHDLGRQALFARLDDQGPRLASFLGLAVGTTVAFGTFLLPADATRIIGLVVAILAGEATSAVVVLRRLAHSITPEPFTGRRYVVSTVLATAAMAPAVAVTWWVLRAWQPERIGELGALLACGALALGAFLLVLRATRPDEPATVTPETTPETTAGPADTRSGPRAERA